MSQVIAAAAAYARVSEEHFRRPCRQRAIARPRQLAMWLFRRLLGRSYPQIARTFRCDHTNVIYAVRQVDERVRRPPEQVWAELAAFAAPEPHGGMQTGDEP